MNMLWPQQTGACTQVKKKLYFHSLSRKHTAMSPIAWWKGSLLEAREVQKCVSHGATAMLLYALAQHCSGMACALSTDHHMLAYR